MSAIHPIDLTAWDGPLPATERAIATDALEAGHVLFLPNLRFELSEAERAYLTPETVGKSKNVSYDPASGKIGGTTVAALKVHDLRALMDRFAASTRTLLATLLPSYKGGLHQAKTSLRPVEVAGRKQTWRKDDTRLHVDSFPSQPSNGKRILRVFTNVNPDGRPRVWKVGEPFESVARKFWGRSRPLPGERRDPGCRPRHEGGPHPVRPLHAEVARRDENGPGVPGAVRGGDAPVPGEQHLGVLHRSGVPRRGERGAPVGADLLGGRERAAEPGVGPASRAGIARRPQAGLKAPQHKGTKIAQRVTKETCVQMLEDRPAGRPSDPRALRFFVALCAIFVPLW